MERSHLAISTGSDPWIRFERDFPNGLQEAAPRGCRAQRRSMGQLFRVQRGLRIVRPGPRDLHGLSPQTGIRYVLPLLKAVPSSPRREVRWRAASLRELPVLPTNGALPGLPDC